MLPPRFRVLWWSGPSLNPAWRHDGPFGTWLEGEAPVGYRLVVVIVHEIDAVERRECIFEREGGV